jgi:hypothetical protein
MVWSNLSEGSSPPISVEETFCVSVEWVSAFLTNPSTLNNVDAIVHVLYEVAGTSAAFASSAAIVRFGNNTSYFMSPVLFTLAGVAWYFITPTPREKVQNNSELSEIEQGDRGSYVKQVGKGSWDFVRSVYVGAKLIFTHRKFCWLFTSYSVALYLHRYLESGIGPAYARRVLGTSAWSQILVGGSNFGELLGALSVFMLATKIPTPIPWLRMDALALNVRICISHTFSANLQ